MSEPEVIVKLTGYTFSASEIREFLDEVSRQVGSGMSPNALIAIEHQCTTGVGAREYTLTASTAYREAD